MVCEYDNSLMMDLWFDWINNSSDINDLGFIDLLSFFYRA